VIFSGLSPAQNLAGIEQLAGSFPHSPSPWSSAWDR
jgi:hypothetical protein